MAERRRERRLPKGNTSMLRKDHLSREKNSFDQNTGEGEFFAKRYFLNKS
jgi:hypothetical protein